MSTPASSDSIATPTPDASQELGLSVQPSEAAPKEQPKKQDSDEKKSGDEEESALTMAQMRATVEKMEKERLKEKRERILEQAKNIRLENELSGLKKEVSNKTSTPRFGKQAALDKRRGLKRGSSDIDEDEDEYANAKRFREHSEDELSDYWPEDGYKDDSGDEVQCTGSKPVERYQVKTAKPLPGIASSKYAPWNSSSTDRSSDFSSSPSIPSAKRGPGRPPKDNSAGNRSIRGYYSSTNGGQQNRGNANANSQYLPRTSYVIRFGGKHNGRPIQDLEDWELMVLFHMPNVRKAHPDFLEAANIDLDRRCLLRAREHREDEYKRVAGKKTKKMFGDFLM